MSENPVSVVCASLVHPAMQEKFKQVLPPDVSLDRFTRVTITAVQNNPGILECDRATLYNACVTAAQRGLLPDGKEGALVSFNTKQGDQWIKKAQFMPMPEGIIKEMAKAGIKAYTVSVYANDTIDMWNDDSGQHVKHKPVVFGDRGDRIGALACAQDSEGRVYVEAMSMDDLSRAQAASKAKDKAGNPTGPWRDWPERMEQKTALHRLRRRVPIIGHDDMTEAFRQDDEQLAPAEQPPPAETSHGLTEELVAKAVVQAAGKAKRPKGLQAVIDAEPEPQSDMGGDEEGEMF